MALTDAQWTEVERLRSSGMTWDAVNASLPAEARYASGMVLQAVRSRRLYPMGRHLHRNREDFDEAFLGRTKAHVEMLDMAITRGKEQIERLQEMRRASLQYIELAEARKEEERQLAAVDA